MDQFPRDERYVVTEQVGHLLRRVYQRHLAIFSELAAESALTSVQFVTLCALKDAGGESSQAELIRATAVDQATIRGVIARLRRRGLIRLARDPGDGRKSAITLTAAGEEALAAMYPRAFEISERTVAALDPVERVALSSLLRKMMA